MRRVARSAEVHLGQSTRQVRHACDRCRGGGGERHLLVGGGYSFSCRIALGLSERDAGSDHEKQRQRYQVSRYNKSIFCVRLDMITLLFF